MNYILPIVALVLSILSLGWQAFTWRKQQHQSRSAANLGVLSEIKLKLADIPEAFRFHGISKEQIEAHGLTEKELSYLVANFMAGQIFYETESIDAGSPFPEGDYRDQICSTADFQNAWPLVKLMLDDTDYKKRIEKTISAYKRTANKVDQRR